MGNKNEGNATENTLLAELQAKLLAIVEEYKKVCKEKAALFGATTESPTIFDQNPLVVELKKLYGELSPELKPLFAALVDTLKSGKFDPKSDILDKMDEVEADIEKILSLWVQINEAFPLENRVCKEPVDMESQLKLAEWKEKIAKLRQAVQKIYDLEEKIRPLIEKVGNKMSQEQATDITENCKAILDTMPADIAQQFENAKTPEQLEKALDVFLDALLADKIGGALQNAETNINRANFILISNVTKKNGKSKKEKIFKFDNFLAKIGTKGSHIIQAKNPEQALTEVMQILDKLTTISKNKTMIGSLVVDSHGHSESYNGVFDLGMPKEAIARNERSLGVGDLKEKEIFSQLAIKDGNGHPKYIDKESDILLSACWAGNHTNMLKAMNEKFNGASVYAQKSVGISIGLVSTRSFSAIPSHTIRFLGGIDYMDSEDVMNMGKWTKVETENGKSKVVNMETLPIIDKYGNVVESDINFQEQHKDRLNKIAKQLKK